MGWGSGTDIFDGVIGSILGSDASDETKTSIVVALINALENHDWDCQSDVVDNDPVVINAFLIVHPDWEWLKERQRENILARGVAFIEDLPNSKKSSTIRYNEATSLLEDMVEVFRENI